MKRSLKNVSLVILLLKMCFVFSQKKVIVIDPGHGGKDAGAIGINGIQEKDVVLSIAKEIVRMNRTVFEDELKIYLTRYRDTLISLSDRARLAKGLKADVFISLHCNHSENPEARGVEVYVSKKDSRYSKESILLAFEIQKGFQERLGFESRGVKFGDFQVLREGMENAPSVLIELTFLSNPIEAKYMLNTDKKRAVGLVVLQSPIGIR